MNGYMIQSRGQPAYFVDINAKDGDRVSHWHGASKWPRREHARYAMSKLRERAPRWVKTWKLRIVKVRLTIEGK